MLFALVTIQSVDVRSLSHGGKRLGDLSCRERAPSGSFLEGGSRQVTYESLPARYQLARGNADRSKTWEGLNKVEISWHRHDAYVDWYSPVLGARLSLAEVSFSALQRSLSTMLP